MGMQAKCVGIEIPDVTNPLLVFLQAMVPTGIFALAFCAIIAAIISTADALMNGVSANITQDFKLADYMKQSNTLHISKATTLIVGMLALGASYHVNQNVIDILIQSYELSVSCLLVHLLFCYFKKDVSTETDYASMLAGFIAFIVFRIYPLPFPRELIALALSCIGYVMVSYARR